MHFSDIRDETHRIVRPWDGKEGFDMGMGHCKKEREQTPDFIFPEVVLFFDYLSL